MAKYEYTTTAAEDAALTRCLADQKAADPAGAPANVLALFTALAKDRVKGVVDHYATLDAKVDKDAILAAYDADPSGITTKLAAEIAAAKG